MNSFLSDFLSYFLPDIVLPAWMQALVSIICLTFFFKLILAVAGLFGHGRY